jgi:tRNA C32,U32 (ribose-2'-O)-methylase TrmJ
MSTQNSEKNKVEDNTNKVYEDFLEHAMHLLNDHQKPVELVAGSMMAIAQRLYKTALNAQDYERIMDVVRDAPVRPYKLEKERLH